MTKKHMVHHHATPFRPGDRVAVSYYGEDPKAIGTFEGYCRGYLSHCIVRWDGAHSASRVKASNLRLVERPIPPLE